MKGGGAWLETLHSASGRRLTEKTHLPPMRVSTFLQWAHGCCCFAWLWKGAT